MFVRAQNFHVVELEPRTPLMLWKI